MLGNKRWLRYGLASLTLAGGACAAFLVACGDDDNGSPTTDAGNTDGQTTNPTDGSTITDDGATGDAGTPAKLILVHGATSLGPNSTTSVLRVCFGTAPAGTDPIVTPFPILPDTLPSTVDASTGAFPGIPRSSGGPFPSSGADYEGLVIRPYLMNADSLHARGVEGNTPGAPGTLRCNQVLKPGYFPDAGWPASPSDAGWDGGGPLQANIDYWQLADIPAGTLKKNHTYILALNGCTADAPNNVACGNADNGSPYVPTGTAGAGNLKLMVFQVDDQATVAATEIGAQVIHASPQWDLGRQGGLLPAFQPAVYNGADAGGDGGSTPIATLTAPDAGVNYDRNATAPSALVKVTGIAQVGGYATISPTSPAFAFPLNNATGARAVQAQTTGDTTSTTPYIVNGKTYTFVLTGNPSDGSLRMLGFPNVFTPPPLQ